VDGGRAKFRGGRWEMGMKVLFVASEIAPWVKTGGLGDVAAA